MSAQSDTPETDAMTWNGHCGDGESVKVVYAHWAQKLERERNDLLRLLEKTRRQLEHALDEIVRGHDSKQPNLETSNKLY